MAEEVDSRLRRTENGHSRASFLPGRRDTREERDLDASEEFADASTVEGNAQGENPKRTNPFLDDSSDDENESVQPRVGTDYMEADDQIDVQVPMAEVIGEFGTENTSSSLIGRLWNAVGSTTSNTQVEPSDEPLREPLLSVERIETVEPRKCCRFSWFCCCCCSVVILVVLGTVAGVIAAQAYKLWNACKDGDCVRFDQLIVPELCGTPVDAKVKLPFDISVLFQLPEEGWLSLSMDDIQVHARLSKTKEELFRTTKFTPVFITKDHDGAQIVREKKLVFGKSEMKLKNAAVLVDEQNGAERIAHFGWQIFNELGGVYLDFTVSFDVWATVLFFPISKHVKFKFKYNCDQRLSWSTGDVECRVDLVSGGETDKDQSDPPLFAQLSKVIFGTVQNPRNMLNATIDTNVTVTENYPALVAHIPEIPLIGVYFSGEKLYPSLDELLHPEGAATHVFDTRSFAMNATRSFIASVSAFIDVSEDMAKLNALRMAAERYISNVESKSFFTYVTLGGLPEDSCFVHQVLNSLAPLRFEVQSMWEDPFSNGKALNEVLNVGSTQREKPELQQFELLSIKSQRDSHLVKSQVGLKMPFTTFGEIPLVEVGLIMDKYPEDVLAIQVKGHSMEEGTFDLELSTDIFVLSPSSFIEQYNVDRFNNVSFVVHGKPESQASLLSSVLANIKYNISLNDTTGDSSSSEMQDDDLGTLNIQIHSTDRLVEGKARFDLFQSLSVRVLINECFTDSRQFEIGPVGKQGPDLSFNLGISALEFGPGTANMSELELRWAPTDDGSALYDFLQAFDQQPLQILKKGCVEIQSLLIPHLQQVASKSPLRSSSQRTFAEVSLQTLSTVEMSPFNIRCGLFGSACSFVGGAMTSVWSWSMKTTPAIERSERRPLIVVDSFPELSFSLQGDAATVLIPSSAPFTVSQDWKFNFHGSMVANISNGIGMHELIQAQKLELHGEVSLFNRVLATFVTKSSSDTNEATFLMDSIKMELENSLSIAQVMISASPTEMVNQRSFQANLRIPGFTADVIAYDSRSGVISVSRRGIVASTDGLVEGFELKIGTTAGNIKPIQKFIASLVNNDPDLTTIRVASSEGDLAIALKLYVGTNGETSKAPSLSVGNLSQVGANNAYIQFRNGIDSRGHKTWELNIPCVIPELCPANPTSLNGEPYTLGYEIMLCLPLGKVKKYVKSSVFLSGPRVSGLIDGYGHTNVLGFQIEKFETKVDFSAEKANFDLQIPIQAQIKNVQLLADAVRDVLESVHAMTFRVSLDSRKEFGLFPQMFQIANMQWSIEATSPDGRPVPTPKDQQWWFPLASVGAWELQSTTKTTMEFIVNMKLKNPSPLDIFIPAISGSVYFLARRNSENREAVKKPPTALLEPLWLGEFRMAQDMLIEGNCTTTHVSKLKVRGNATQRIQQDFCSNFKASDPSTVMNCIPSKLLEQLIAGAETRVLVQGKFNDMEGNQLTANFEAILHEGGVSKRVQPYKPGPRYALDLPIAAKESAIDEFVSVFDTVKVSGWTSFWETLVKEGVNLAVMVAIHNPFVFPFKVNSYDMALTYDDPTGEYLSYLPEAFSPAHDINLVTSIRSDNLGLFVNPGASRFTPTQTVRLLERKVEHACRLYNAAEKVGYLCSTLPSGRVDLSIGDFSWSQYFEIYNVSLVGSNACLSYPQCLVRFISNDQIKRGWSVVGSAKKKLQGSALSLTDGGFAQVGAGWLDKPVPISDGFDVSFNFSIQDTSTLGGGDGIAFVVQRDGGPKAIGNRCLTTPCNGYDHLTGGGPSFAVMLYQTSAHYVELHGVIDGDSTLRVGYASSPKLSPLHNGRVHNMRIIYSRNDRKVFVLVNGEWQATFSVWEPALVDTGPCSAGSAAPQKNTCIDMDSIAGINGSAWVGFTGSTGYSMTSTQSVLGFQWRTPKVDLTKSFLLEEGRVLGSVGTLVKFTVDLRDSCAGPIRKLSPVGVTIVTAVADGSSEHEIVELFHSPDSNGVLECGFQPKHAGLYRIHVFEPLSQPPESHVVGSFSVWQNPI